MTEVFVPKSGIIDRRDYTVPVLQLKAGVFKTVMLSAPSIELFQSWVIQLHINSVREKSILLYAQCA